MPTHNLSGTLNISLAFSGIIRAAPRVESVEAITSTKVRIRFNVGMRDDNLLRNPFNYLFEPSAGGATVYTKNITPGPGLNPKYIDAETTEHTDGINYNAQVNYLEGGPTNRFGINVAAGDSSALYAGIGINPKVARVVAVSQNRVDVIFTERMLDNSDIRNIGNYSFTGGLSVVSVLDVVDDTVQLVTTDQTPGAVYELTIAV